MSNRIFIDLNFSQ